MPGLNICSWPECGKVIRVKEEVYQLSGLPGINYCSRDCVEKAHAERYKDKKATQMERLAEEFGDAGVIRRFCDRCNAPIHLCWKGREGEYCSNVCLKLAEKQQGETQVTDQNETPAAVTTPASPITAGSSKSNKKKSAPAVKKTAVKSAAKSVPVVEKAAPKVAAPASTPSVRSKYPDDANITVLSPDHGLKGKRGDSLDSLLKASTMKKFRESLAKKDLAGYAGFAIKTAFENKLAKIG